MEAVHRALETLDRLAAWKVAGLFVLLAGLILVTGFSFYTAWYPKELREVIRENLRLSEELEVRRKDQTVTEAARRSAEEAAEGLRRQLVEPAYETQPDSLVESLGRERCTPHKLVTYTVDYEAGSVTYDCEHKSLQAYKIPPASVVELVGRQRCPPPDKLLTYTVDYKTGFITYDCDDTKSSRSPTSTLPKTNSPKIGR